jgi:hypothetical protein
MEGAEEMTRKSGAPSKRISPNVAATPPHPIFTRIGPRSSATTAEFDQKHMGIASKE